MDINGDGAIDVLSGSYAYNEGEPRVGLFQVLEGQPDGSFAAPKPLTCAEGNPLVIKASTPGDYCTRPTAVDLNGDGHLDIVSGNFTGTFAVFMGTEDGFAAENDWLLDDGGNQIKVAGKSDPFFIDWDGDGDQDMLSGSGAGGVFLFANEGNATEPKFAKSATLIDGPKTVYGWQDTNQPFGIDHLDGPQAYSRVWAGDVDEDGKLDILVGDNVMIRNDLPEYTEEELAAHAAAEKEMEEIMNGPFVEFSEKYQELTEAGDEEALAELQKEMEEIQERYMALYESLPQEYSSAGFVWLYRGK